MSGRRVRVTVPAEAAGERLDRFLAGLPDVASRQVAQRLLEGGAVTVDEGARTRAYKLVGGEKVVVELPDEPPVELEPDASVPVHVAWEDEHLLVVDKPAGVVVHPAPGHRTGTLAAALLTLGAAGGEAQRPGIVHRLDRDTSGLMVVARSPEVHRRLQRLVRRREVERTYAALVRGRPRSWRGRIDAPIGRDRTDSQRHSMDTDRPRDAVTHFTVERLLNGHALLEVRLETGRTHQIRVHLAAIDLPVIGDQVYGIPEPALRRQFLHASRLAFDHPITGERVEVSSPLPPALERYLERFPS